MESSILTVTADRRESSAVRAGPSATLDLIYASYFLHGLARRPSDAPSWAKALRERAPDVAQAAAGLASDGEGQMHLISAFGMAVHGGYVWDDDPERFFDDLPRVAREMRTAVEADAVPDMNEKMRAFVASCDIDDLARRITDVLRPLWSELGPYWQDEGRALAAAAANNVEERFAECRDVVRALPAHHFVQFEALAESLRAQTERGPVWVVPLALAASGGFHLEVAGTPVVGFGLSTDDLFAETEERVAGIAQRAKALADPTRLMLLSILARWTASELTVGDLARQLGVSQPTVSGHLKTLKSAGVIHVKRDGNRSLPSLDQDGTEALLHDLRDVLHRPEAE